MSLDSEQIKIKCIKDSLLEAYYASKKAHEVLFRHLENEHFNESRDEIIAGICLSKAISIMSTVKAIYYADIEELEHQDVEDILHQFDVFSNEFINNLSSNHSHQWTDLEFEKYKEIMSNSFDIS